MGAGVQVQSNLFLPYGKVRIGFKVFWAYFEYHPCPLGATCLPMLGTLLAPHGHAACPFRAVFVVFADDCALC